MAYEVVTTDIFRVGTSVYVAPEILKGEKYDISADVYSLSITIWEILHRRCRILIKFNFLEFRTIILLLSLIFPSEYVMGKDHY